MVDLKDLLFIEEEWNDDGARNHNWKVIPSTSKYLGISYGDWASKWLSWLINSDPDLNNNGPVVFLRGVDFEQDNGSYDHFIRIRERRLRMSLGQALFWPIICLFVDERGVPSLDNAQKRLTDVFQGLLNADNPPLPHQATIEGESIVSSLKEFLIFSQDFTLHVPKPSYQSPNTSTLGPLFKYPVIYEGEWKSVIGGYFLLIKPMKSGVYTIASNGNAEDGYHTETLVDIEVMDNSPDNRWEAQSKIMREIIDKEISNQMAETKEEKVLSDKFATTANKYSEIIDKTHVAD